MDIRKNSQNVLKELAFLQIAISEVPLVNFSKKNEKLCMPTISLSAIIK